MFSYKPKSSFRFSPLNQQARDSTANVTLPRSVTDDSLLNKLATSNHSGTDNYVQKKSTCDDDSFNYLTSETWLELFDIAYGVSPLPFEYASLSNVNFQVTVPEVPKPKIGSEQSSYASRLEGSAFDDYPKPAQKSLRYYSSKLKSPKNYRKTCLDNNKNLIVFLDACYRIDFSSILQPEDYPYNNKSLLKLAQNKRSSVRNKGLDISQNEIQFENWVCKKDGVFCLVKKSHYDQIHHHALANFTGGIVGEVKQFIRVSDKVYQFFTDPKSCIEQQQISISQNVDGILAASSSTHDLTLAEIEMITEVDLSNLDWLTQDAPDKKVDKDSFQLNHPFTFFYPFSANTSEQITTNLFSPYPLVKKPITS